MANAIATGLYEASINLQIAKDARLCQECGKQPVPYRVENWLTYGKFGIGCPERHGLVENEASPRNDGDLRAFYQDLMSSIGPMIDAWNDKQEEIRNQKMFPGARRHAEA